MRLSHFFLPILKEKPAEASIVSHSYMLRAGMIRQLSSGIYSWLPLGLKVLKNIETIVREELNRSGALEVLMPSIQPASLWQESGRYDDYGKEMLRITDRHDNAMLFGPTHEEVITDIFRNTVQSYKDLPVNLYQIQWKFRDEIRPRFGVMRGREFFMKDGYSFDINEEASRNAYELMFETYMKIFQRLGVQAIPVRADNGAIGGDLSHEFHIVANTGESEIFYDAALESLSSEEAQKLKTYANLYAAADEMHDPKSCPISEDRIRSKRGIEVAHVFNFGTKYTDAMKAFVLDANGKQIAPYMGSYGIGVSRLVGGIIEAFHDDNGIMWPEAVAPFHLSLINLKPGDASCDALSQTLYSQIINAGHDVLLDDMAGSAGQKFATHDLIGNPWQIIIGPKKIAEGLVEVKYRRTGERQDLSPESALNHIISPSR